MRAARGPGRPRRTHLDVSDDAEMEKKVALACDAMHLPSSVLPVPGGPNSSRPLGGPSKPVKMSLDQDSAAQRLLMSAGVARVLTLGGAGTRTGAAWAR